VPTFIAVGIWTYLSGDWAGLPVIVSALWHLILLKPAMDKERPFVCWHGRQALVLAGLRTIVPLAIAIWEDDFEAVPAAIPLLIVVWLFGTLWGQRQADRGDCSILRWFARDQAEAILTSVEWEKEAVDINKQSKDLVYAIRFGRSPAQREAALAELEALDLVEPL
jgi:hypothetical protein